MSATGWYWCLSHGQVEEGAGCRAGDRMGPYESPEAARHWKDRVEARNDRWEGDDREWEDDEDQPPAGGVTARPPG